MEMASGTGILIMSSVLFIKSSTISPTDEMNEN